MERGETMRFFPVYDTQLLILTLALGVVGVILALAAWAGYSSRKPSCPPDEPAPRDEVELLLSHDEEKKPVVPFLYYIYAGILAWAVGYMIIIGVRGTSF